MTANVGDSKSRATIDAMQAVGREEKLELTAEQISAQKSAQASNEETAFVPRTQRETKTLKSRSSKVTNLAKMKREKGMIPIQRIKESAQQYERRNPELKAQILTLLRERIKPGATKNDIMRIIKEFYIDVTLMDEVMEFLMDTTEGALYQTVKESKDELSETMGREIAAGRNISTVAREAAEKGLGTPTSLRDMYRDITGNPREPTSLFEELSSKYAYKELSKVIKFLFHSLGSDMKAKGPSIARGELYRLMTETRTLQAILGVYRFFSGRMPLVRKMMAKEGLEVPKELNFETLAKEFIGLVNERYPNGDRVKERAVRLGIEDWIIAKIIAFSQFRDSVREVAMLKIYRSLQHRDDLFSAILEALEELEDALEEEEERKLNEEEDEEGGSDGKEEGSNEDEEEKK